MNKAMKGGAGATLIAVFMAATFAGGVSLAGLTTTFTSAFDGINFESDTQFLKDFIATNIKTACDSDGRNVSIPSGGNITKHLSSIERIRIKKKDTLLGLGDEFMVLQADKGSNIKNIRLDTNGVILDGWRCNSAGNDGIRINTTSSGTLSKGTWVDTPTDKVQHFRILEIPDDTNKVRLQVRQTDG